MSQCEWFECCGSLGMTSNEWFAAKINNLYLIKTMLYYTVVCFVGVFYKNDLIVTALRCWMTMIVTFDKFIENVTDAISAHKKAPFS